MTRSRSIANGKTVVVTAMRKMFGRMKRGDSEAHLTINKNVMHGRQKGGGHGVLSPWIFKFDIFLKTI